MWSLHAFQGLATARKAICSVEGGTGLHAAECSPIGFPGRLATSLMTYPCIRLENNDLSGLWSNLEAGKRKGSFQLTGHERFTYLKSDIEQ